MTEEPCPRCQILAELIAAHKAQLAAELRVIAAEEQMRALSGKEINPELQALQVRGLDYIRKTIANLESHL